MSEEVHTYVSPHLPDGSRFMRTNHGPHPAEFWAQVTAEGIMNIGPNVTGTRRIAALALLTRIQTALERFHTEVQTSTRKKLEGLANVPLDITPDHVDPALIKSAMAAILAEASGTEWERYFNDPKEYKKVAEYVTRHFANSMLVEHGWHNDRLGAKV